MVSRAYHLQDSRYFAQQALQWASTFDSACCLDSNAYRDNYGNIDVFIAVGEDAAFHSEIEDRTFERLQAFVNRNPGTWIPGFLSYDLKNQLEKLETPAPNRTGMPDAYFFVPKYTLLIGKFNVEIKGENPDAVMAAIRGMEITTAPIAFQGELKHRVSQQEYYAAFERLRHHLHQGDCYEVNLCQEFYSDPAEINPLGLYQALNRVSPSPFSCFFKFGERYILSASPERFLSKQGDKLLSQPIKGTARRGASPEEDAELRRSLASSEKDISENVMIVDLVRNDLTRSARPGTVRVTELAGVYSFKQVHQLISTVTCELDPAVSATQAIANAFPPGSMTGAPKVRAMELIDQYELSRRGAYSGAIGYFGPQGNFDFSVIIRSLVYNAEKQYLSFHTGGAITLQSDPEQEYNECLLKGKALFEILNNSPRV